MVIIHQTQRPKASIGCYGDLKKISVVRKGGGEPWKTKDPSKKHGEKKKYLGEVGAEETRSPSCATKQGGPEK